jgi:hypothetical protein
VAEDVGEADEERMARRKRARSSDSSASGMAGSVLGGSRRGARRKTTGMETSRSTESTNGEVYAVAGDVISGQGLEIRPMQRISGRAVRWGWGGVRSDFSNGTKGDEGIESD